MSGETKQRISELEAEIARLKEAQPTLRDQFAMAALPPIMGKVGIGSDSWAKHAYDIADAMLQARRTKDDT